MLRARVFSKITKIIHDRARTLGNGARAPAPVDAYENRDVSWPLCHDNRPGGVVGQDTEGLYYRLTRFLSRLRITVDGVAPRCVAADAVNSYTSVAYFLARSPAGKQAGPEPESRQTGDEIVQKGIELQISRFVGGGFCDEIYVTNHALAPATVALRWDVDADFADYSEATQGKRQQTAPVGRQWRPLENGGELVIRYGHPKLRHAIELRFSGFGGFSYDGAVCLRLPLIQQEPVRLTLVVTPVFCGERVESKYVAGAHDIVPTAATRRIGVELSTPNRLVQAAWDQAVTDLAALALLDGDEAEPRMPGAGIPKYNALFGRDVLVTAFQAGCIDPLMLRGSLRQIAKWNATSYDERFDAEPGRVIHQHQESPLALLEKSPFLHYYGDYAAPGWFLIDTAWDFLLTGDTENFHLMRDAVLATLDWMDRHGDGDGDGLYEYVTKACDWGEKNQGWKDSRDAILCDDGRLVHDPIALVEIQGCYYAAKQLIALAFEKTGEAERAGALRGEAERLKSRFNATFWLAGENYFALALDPEKKPVRTISPDAAQCLAYGIIADEFSRAVATRLMMPDLFTGWGLRSLSSRHPAFNPFAYHLGSVWPVSNAIIGLGLKRYGFNTELHRLAKALFEASEVFELNRLPEVFGGHPRDGLHPHPGIYPEANAPQAWSASAVISLVQSMLGLVPAAPWGALIVDPNLPDWLPEVELKNIRIGQWCASIRFWRESTGTTRYEVVQSNGGLRIHRCARRNTGVDRWTSELRALDQRCSEVKLHEPDRH
jgi:glycogen debranching enzyme